ncbi:stage II sporulation protein R [Psychrobacillus sp. FJAT-51614]|uniref:Stage II sporulation protein R n=1 Tax=Psychrobacillus mangrovi TaxID=3117745 RepID=A0ABU8F3S6_9BACI
MLPDYEIKRAPSIGKQIDAFILFVWMLLLIQFCLFILFQPMDQTDGTRFRLIANSNSVEDQQLKNEVKNSIEPILRTYASNPEKTYAQLEQTVDNLSEKYEEKIILSTGQALFPPKVWNDGISAQTYVESIVITIGSGRGDNWWCALFPKVCYKEEIKEEKKKEKPKFFVWEWLKKKFST